MTEPTPPSAATPAGIVPQTSLPSHQVRPLIPPRPPRRSSDIVVIDDDDNDSITAAPIAASSSAALLQPLRHASPALPSSNASSLAPSRNGTPKLVEPATAASSSAAAVPAASSTSMQSKYGDVANRLHEEEKADHENADNAADDDDDSEPSQLVVKSDSSREPSVSHRESDAAPALKNPPPSADNEQGKGALLKRQPSQEQMSVKQFLQLTPPTNQAPPSTGDDANEEDEEEEDIELLDWSHRQLKYAAVEGGWSLFPSITTLILSDNDLITLTKSGIETLPNLFKLDLRRNKLNGFGETLLVLSQCRSLKYLYLHQSTRDNVTNQISLYTDFVFQSLRGLEMCDDIQSTLTIRLNPLDQSAFEFIHLISGGMSENSLLRCDLSNRSLPASLFFFILSALYQLKIAWLKMDGSNEWSTLNSYSNCVIYYLGKYLLYLDEEEITHQRLHLALKAQNESKVKFEKIPWSECATEALEAAREYCDDLMRHQEEMEERRKKMRERVMRSKARKMKEMKRNIKGGDSSGLDGDIIAASSIVSTHPKNTSLSFEKNTDISPNTKAELKKEGLLLNLSSASNLMLSDDEAEDSEVRLHENDNTIMQFTPGGSVIPYKKTNKSTTNRTSSGANGGTTAKNGGRGPNKTGVELTKKDVEDEGTGYNFHIPGRGIASGPMPGNSSVVAANSISSHNSNVGIDTQLSTKLEILIHYLQVYGLILLSSIHITWPSAFYEFSNWVRIFTLNLEAWFSFLPFESNIFFWVVSSFPLLLVFLFWRISRLRGNLDEWIDSYINQWSHTKLIVLSSYFAFVITGVIFAILFMGESVYDGHTNPNNANITAAVSFVLFPSIILLLWYIAIRRFRNGYMSDKSVDKDKFRGDWLSKINLAQWLCLFLITNTFMPVSRVILRQFQCVCDGAGNINLVQNDTSICYASINDSLRCFPYDYTSTQIAAFICGGLYLIGIPIFYYFLISKTVMLVLSTSRQYKLLTLEIRRLECLPKAERRTKEVQAELKEYYRIQYKLYYCIVNNPLNSVPASSLFAAFQYDYKYTKLFQMFEKVGLVIVTLFVPDYLGGLQEGGQIIWASVIIITYLIVLVIIRPYNDPLDDTMDIIAEAGNTTNILVAMSIVYNAPWLSLRQANILLFVANGVIIVSFIMAFIISPLKTYWKRKKLQERLEQEEKEEEEKIQHLVKGVKGIKEKKKAAAEAENGAAVGSDGVIINAADIDPAIRLIEADKQQPKFTKPKSLEIESSRSGNGKITPMNGHHVRMGSNEKVDDALHSSSAGGNVKSEGAQIVRLHDEEDEIEMQRRTSYDRALSNSLLKGTQAEVAASAAASTLVSPQKAVASSPLRSPLRPVPVSPHRPFSPPPPLQIPNTQQRMIRIHVNEGGEEDLDQTQPTTPVNVNLQEQEAVNTNAVNASGITSHISSPIIDKNANKNTITTSSASKSKFDSAAERVKAKKSISSTMLPTRPHHRAQRPSLASLAELFNATSPPPLHAGTRASTAVGAIGNTSVPTSSSGSAFASYPLAGQEGHADHITRTMSFADRLTSAVGSDSGVQGGKTPPTLPKAEGLGSSSSASAATSTAATSLPTALTHETRALSVPESSHLQRKLSSEERDDFDTNFTRSRADISRMKQLTLLKLCSPSSERTRQGMTANHPDSNHSNASFTLTPFTPGFNRATAKVEYPAAGASAAAAAAAPSSSSSNDPMMSHPIARLRAHSGADINPYAAAPAISGTSRHVRFGSKNMTTQQLRQLRTGTLGRHVLIPTPIEVPVDMAPVLAQYPSNPSQQQQATMIRQKSASPPTINVSLDSGYDAPVVLTPTAAAVMQRLERNASAATMQEATKVTKQNVVQSNADSFVLPPVRVSHANAPIIGSSSELNPPRQRSLSLSARQQTQAMGSQTPAIPQRPNPSPPPTNNANTTPASAPPGVSGAAADRAENLDMQYEIDMIREADSDDE